MQAELAISGRTDSAAGYLTWTPVPGQVRLTDASGAAAPVAVKLRNKTTQSGGQVVFYSGLPGTAQNELQLSLPLNGSAVQFFIGGLFGKPSTDNGDAIVEVATTPGNQVISSTPLMVRIRKNANTLTTNERNRFRSALATLNNRGMGKFSDFRRIHGPEGYFEEHQGAGFLPWHRAFVLDLERELQNIDPSVTMPYWRFDQPAPNVFTPDFVGVAGANGRVEFSSANPLQFFATDGAVGVLRPAGFDTQTQSAFVINEAATFNLGNPGNIFARFTRMEGNPHGSAHTSFGGYMQDPTTAAKDPLFFLLHSNVDRLWAKWQWLRHRFDITSTASYQYLGSATSAGATRIGHNLLDTMWPWNGVTVAPRPSIAPGGSFPPSTPSSAPGTTPAVQAMIDFQGLVTPASRLGFDYDDVPYQP